MGGGGGGGWGGGGGGGGVGGSGRREMSVRRLRQLRVAVWRDRGAGRRPALLPRDAVGARAGWRHSGWPARAEGGLRWTPVSGLLAAVEPHVVACGARGRSSAPCASSRTSTPRAVACSSTRPRTCGQAAVRRPVAAPRCWRASRCSDAPGSAGSRSAWRERSARPGSDCCRARAAWRRRPGANDNASGAGAVGARVRARAGAAATTRLVVLVCGCEESGYSAPVRSWTRTTRPVWLFLYSTASPPPRRCGTCRRRGRAHLARRPA